MRSAIATLIMVFFMTGTAVGQTSQQQAQVHRGKTLFWTGAGLLGCGLFMLPLTTTATAHSNYDPPFASAGFLTAGGTLMWIGTRIQQKATQPTLTLGVTVGRKSAVHVRRSW